MSINKETASQLRKRGKHYATFDPQVFDLIRSSEAAAIWVYLITKNENWTVRKSDIQKRFNIGRDKVTKAFRHLKELRLLEDKVIHDGKKIVGRELIVWSEQYDGEPVELKTSPTENQYDGKSVHIIKDQLLPNNQDITNDQKEHTSEPSVTDPPPKYSTDDLMMAKGMIGHVQEDYPSLKADPCKWADQLRKLREFDGYTIQQIAETWAWVRQDQFWSKNCQSLAKFRQRNRDGVRYIDLFIQQRQQKQQPIDQPDPWETVINAISRNDKTLLSPTLLQALPKPWGEIKHATNWELNQMRQQFNNKIRGIA